MICSGQPAGLSVAVPARFHASIFVSSLRRPSANVVRYASRETSPFRRAHNRSKSGESLRDHFDEVNVPFTSSLRHPARQPFPRYGHAVRAIAAQDRPSMPAARVFGPHRVRTAAVVGRVAERHRIVRADIAWRHAIVLDERIGIGPKLFAGNIGLASPGHRAHT